MIKPRILAVGVANPDLYMSQADVHDFYKQQKLMPSAQKELYSRILLDGPIRGRYFGLEDPEEIIGEGVDEQVDRYTQQAREIATRAAQNALRHAQLSPADIGGIVANTCTAYLCPGLTSYIAEDLGLQSNIKAIDIMGMGCGAAIPNLECGCGMLQSTRGKPILCIATEICSATHLVEDDPGITVSNCIFGDGAAAVVLGAGTDSDPCLADFETGLFPKHREALRYTRQNGHLRNQLTRRVPVIGAQCITKVAQRLLAQHDLGVADIGWWAVHAGGTSVLDQIAQRLELSDDALAASTEIFQRHGNMSSPTVLFVLQRLMQRNELNGPGLLLAFGAGFTAFAALVNDNGKHKFDVKSSI